MRKGAIVVLLCWTSIACELDLAITSPTSPGNISNTNTNTNDNNRNPDRSDIDTRPTPPGTGSPTAPIPLPTYGESVTREVAALNPALVANSCQDLVGASAWGFLDVVIQTLRTHGQDQRWGYLCKDASCTDIGEDVITYQATSGRTGIWIVDIIEHHCPAPGFFAGVKWGVLPFDTTKTWSATR